MSQQFNLNGELIVPEEPEDSNADFVMEVMTDEDATGDTVLGTDIDVSAILIERERKIAEMLQTMDEQGGVNMQIAVEMEQLHPGVISKYRPINSYTRDFSRTNYKETRISLEVMHVAAIAAVAVGVGVLLAAFIGWLLNTFFPEEGGGGGGKGKKGKAIDDRLREIGEAQAEAEELLKECIQKAKSAQGKLKEEMLKTLPEKDREALRASGDAYEKYLRQTLYKDRLRSSYTVYVDEVLGGKGGEHLKLITDLVKQFPSWVKQLDENQTKLLEMSKDGNTEEVKPEDFFVNVNVLGKKGQEVKALLEQKAEQYKKICSRADDEWWGKVEVKSGKVLGTSDFMGNQFDTIDDSQKMAWERIKKTMNSNMDAMKKANPVKERQTALKTSWLNMKYGFNDIINGYRIINHCRENAARLADDLSKAHTAQLKFIEAISKKGMEHAESQADKDAYKEMNGKAGGGLSKLSSWASALFGKKAKAEDSKDRPNKTDEENKPIE